jgi:hypothetical protein
MKPRIATRAAIAALLLVTSGCGGNKTTEKRITPEQIQLLATAFFNNYQGKGAEFRLTSLDRPGGRTITMAGQIDFEEHRGGAMVTGGAAGFPVTEVFWANGRVLERRPALDAVLGEKGITPGSYLLRAADVQHRRLDMLIGILTGLALKVPENAQLIRQKEGTAFLREDSLRNTKVDVLRYGQNVILWIDPETGNLLRFEGRNSAGTLPVIVDILELKKFDLPGPSVQQIVDVSTWVDEFNSYAPESP